DEQGRELVHHPLVGDHPGGHRQDAGDRRPHPGGPHGGRDPPAPTPAPPGPRPPRPPRHPRPVSALGGPAPPRGTAPPTRAPPVRTHAPYGPSPHRHRRNPRPVYALVGPAHSGGIVRRYRSHTPAARLRDAPARSRRRRRAALAGSAVVFAVVLGGVAISVSGPPRVSTAAWTGGSGQEAGPDLDADADAVTRPPTPDGHVHLDEAGGPHRLPAGWADVPAVLTGAVDAAGDDGLDLSLCVRAIDSPTAPMRCAGGVERAYAASVTKLAYAVGALE